MDVIHAKRVHLQRERNGQQIVCVFLDVRKAFDRVWHDGLFVKLNRLSIDNYIVKSVISMYSEMTSYVLHEGCRSKPFLISQGTRQGGVSSPMCYLAYINDLLTTLESSGCGTVIHQLSCCCPTVADDMVLASYTKQGLSNMIEQCYSYSTKWRYEYNAAKCGIIVFNESDEDKLTSCREWKLGSSAINECEKYTHLGIVMNRQFTLKDCVEEACKKLRGTFFGFINSGINKYGLNPLTSISIYKSVVIPRALYGSELWTDISQSDIMKIEVAHRFCLKYIQDLGLQTRTNLMYFLLNMHAI